MVAKARKRCIIKSRSPNTFADWRWWHPARTFNWTSRTRKTLALSLALRLYVLLYSGRRTLRWRYAVIFSALFLFGWRPRTKCSAIVGIRGTTLLGAMIPIGLYIVEGGLCVCVWFCLHTTEKYKHRLQVDSEPLCVTIWQSAVFVFY